MSEKPEEHGALKVVKGLGCIGIFALSVILSGAGLIYSLKSGDENIKREENQHFSTAKILEGKVETERFIPGKSGLFGCPDRYIMTIRLPDNSVIEASYSDENASVMDALYNPGDNVTFRDGFKPNYKPGTGAVHSHLEEVYNFK